MARTTDWLPSLWLDRFDMLLDEELDYGDSWSLNFNYNLMDTLDQAERRRGWKKFCVNTHGNFQCSSCRKTWPSARVMVLFHYRLRGGRGTVIMRPFGQSCRRCQGTFEFPGFSEEAVTKALCKLFSKIRKNIYNDYDANYGGASDNVSRVWTKPHETSLCEACRNGICSQNEDNEN